MLPRADAQAGQVHAALVVEHPVQRVGELHAQLLPPASFELRGGVRRAEGGEGVDGVLLGDARGTEVVSRCRLFKTLVRYRHLVVVMASGQDRD